MSFWDRALYLLLLPISAFASAGWLSASGGYTPAPGHAAVVLLFGCAVTYRRLARREWTQSDVLILMGSSLAACLSLAAGIGLLSWLAWDSGGLFASTLATYATLACAYRFRPSSAP